MLPTHHRCSAANQLATRQSISLVVNDGGTSWNIWCNKLVNYGINLASAVVCFVLVRYRGRPQAVQMANGLANDNVYLCLAFSYCFPILKCQITSKPDNSFHLRWKILHACDLSSVCHLLSNNDWLIGIWYTVAPFLSLLLLLVLYLQ